MVALWCATGLNSLVPGGTYDNTLMSPSASWPHTLSSDIRCFQADRGMGLFLSAASSCRTRPVAAVASSVLASVSCKDCCSAVHSSIHDLSVAALMFAVAGHWLVLLWMLHCRLPTATLCAAQWMKRGFRPVRSASRMTVVKKL